MARIVDFNDSVNVRGLGPVDVSMADPSPGAHTVLITDMWKESNEKSGKTTYRFSVTDTEPGSTSAGVQTMIMIGCDAAKDFNVQHLVNCLLSIGCAPEKIQGVVQGIRPALFKGRPAFIFVKAAPEGEVDEETGKPKRDNKNFVTPQQYESLKKAESMKSVAGANGSLGLAARPAAQVQASIQAPVQAPAAVVQAPMQPTITGPTGSVQGTSNSSTAAEIGNLFGN
jgi:hypothetical protein